MTRQFLQMVCHGLIAVVLWAQLAISAYACPGLSPAAANGAVHQATADAAVNPQAMPCGDMSMPMDPAFPNLCAEHCHPGQQSDHVPSLTVPAVLRVALYAIPPAPEPSVRPRPAADAAAARGSASPPHAILHCCFRI